MPEDQEFRTYINHLLAEHRRLNGMLRQMQHAIASSIQPDETPSFVEMGRILARLRQELREREGALRSLFRVRREPLPMRRHHFPRLTSHPVLPRW